MQNLPISPLAAPQSGVILPDTAVPKVPYGESFNAILARESSGKTFADEIIDNVPPASATTASLLPQAEVEPTTLLLQLDTELIPLGQNPAAPALLTLVPGTINPQSSRAVELSTELSALPTLPTAPATYPDKPGWEPVEFVDTADRKNTADSAAPGKFLPPLVAPDSVANSGTGQPTASQISDASLVSQPNNLALVG